MLRLCLHNTINRLSSKNRLNYLRLLSSTARLVLEDGQQILGERFGYKGKEPITGEIVFNTGMTGYNETLSDPSYKGQILVLTYPLVGNYGTPNNAFDEFGLRRYFESDHGPQISGLVVSEYCQNYSHWQASRSLSEWLEDHKVPAIQGVDTRALTKTIREKGTMLAKLMDADLNPSSIDFVDINSQNLVEQVSRKEIRTYEPVASRPNCHILAVDCGMKNSILRRLLERNAKVTVVPWDHDFVSMFQDNPDKYNGLFLSNGPGDPQVCAPTIRNLKTFLENPELEHIPVFGICLGHQLLSTAAGATTYKLPYGHRSQNQPAKACNAFGDNCFITSQNHGYAVDTASIDSNSWRPLFINTNDNTNEGLVHQTRPIFSVQFHPEARCGPTDTTFLFDEFLAIACGKKKHILQKFQSEYLHQRLNSFGEFLVEGGNVLHRISDWNIKQNCTLRENSTILPSKKYNKVLMIGSGGLQIGQAGEFDYSGSQALKALKQEGIHTVLINPNIATVQTSTPITSTGSCELADEMYFLPVTPEFVESVIRKERPDGILLQFGGQTALNCGVSLYNSGVLEKYGVDVLGTPVSTIVATEDREIFAEKLREIGETLAPSIAATNIEDAVAAGEKIGFPVIVRAAFSLGGLGSGFANNKAELKDLVSRALAATPQVLVEKSLKGWKELEYEIVRDRYDNTIAVCNMENFDPLGIHTGDSIVIAPSQTLNDVEYHMLREAAIRIVRHVGVVGECNVQFALDPNSLNYIIIEMNPRLSRSSALASKATGYPLAFVAAKLALGKSLVDIENSVTGQTKSCFEPSLDYVVTKMPRWDLNKFDNVSKYLGSGMKSVGEVMAIGRNFEESLQKAIRMVYSDGNKIPGFAGELFSSEEDSVITEELTKPTDQRIFALAKALQKGWTVDRIHSLTKIDKWFLYKLKSIIDLEVRLKANGNVDDADLMQELKKKGFSDNRISKLVGNGWTEKSIRDLRKRQGIVPVFKQIDTLAAEFPAKTNYLYSSYHGNENDISVIKNDPDHFMVLGGGGYRIGSSVEFDFGSVRCAQTLRKHGKKTTMVNFNPETVSTDYDESDFLFFEELSSERVQDINDVLNPGGGVIVSFGGQIPNNLAMKLHEAGLKLVGTSATAIDNAEDRSRFSALMDSIGVSQPEWASFVSFDDALSFSNRVGYPVLVRPSYVLSGAGMEIVYDSSHLEDYLRRHSVASSVVVSKFMEDWIEVDLDAVASQGKLIANCVSEHIERAGVHSGDACLVFPSKSISERTHRMVVEIGEKMAAALNITGPFNSQILIPPHISDSELQISDLKVIECNVRASRSLPFVSKILGKDLTELATLAMIEKDISHVKEVMYNKPNLGFYGVKVPQFSFTRLLGADPVLGVEMASTGEVACFGTSVEEAFIKALMASNFKLPTRSKAIILSTGSEKNKDAMIPYVQKVLDMGFEVYATPGTAQHLKSHNIPVSTCYWDLGGSGQGMHPKASSLLSNQDVDLVINVPSTDKGDRKDEISNCFLVRRAAVDFSIPLITNLKVAQVLIDALSSVNYLSGESYRDILRFREQK